MGAAAGEGSPPLSEPFLKIAVMIITAVETLMGDLRHRKGGVCEFPPSLPADHPGPPSTCTPSMSEPSGPFAVVPRRAEKSVKRGSGTPFKMNVAFLETLFRV